VLAGLGFWLGPQIADAAVQAADRLSGAWESVARSLQQQDWVRHLQQQFPSVPAFLKSTGSTLSAFVGSLFTGAVNAVVGFLVVLFVGIYLAVDPDVYRQGFVSLVPPARRERARQVLDRLQTVLWRWILGQLSSMAIIGICTVIGMWALGLPIPITLGLISGTLTFIPNFGPILSAVPQVLLALTQSPMLAVYVLAFHTGLQFIESYFVTPLIQQHQVRLPAVMIIMAQVLMGALTGILGLIFATPLFAAGMVLVKELYLRDVLGDDDAARFEGIDP
jgi:predicted PurR-regulated permease PerM